MSNKYYITSNGSFRELSDDELMHWKYTRREKKNGEWVYYYDNDKLGVKNFIDTKITGKAYKQHAKEASEEKRKVDNEKFSTTQSRIHAEQTSKGYSQTDPKVVALKAQEAVLSKKSTELDKEYAKAEADHATKSLSGIVTSNVKNLKSNGKAFIDRLKDNIGVDEWRNTEKEKREYEIAAEKYITADNNTRAVEKEYRNASSEDRDHDKMHDAYVQSSIRRETKERSWREYSDARSELMSTPLGTIYKAKETIERGAQAIDDLFAKMFTKKHKKR